MRPSGDHDGAPVEEPGRSHHSQHKKSTLLRCVNGLEQIDGGAIHVGDVRVSNDDAMLRKLRLRVGMIFQQFNLFPHMTVDLEAANLRAFLAHHAHDAETPSRASTFDEQLMYPATQFHALDIDVPRSIPMRIGPRHIEYRADQLD
ncbi:amino acid ABC transporter ATP-binding protein [Burkholderia vietnamiensis]